MIGVIDAQGFIGRNGEFILKEVAIMHCGSDRIETFLLRPPYSSSTLPGYRRKTCKYVQLRVHGIDWYSGDFAYDTGLQFIKDTLRDNCMYYAKGHDKSKALSDSLGVTVHNVENVFDEGEFRSYFVYHDKGQVKCSFHSRKDPYFLCAVKQVHALCDIMNCFLNPNVSKFEVSYINLDDEDSRLLTFSYIRSPLGTSSVVHYLAKIGYFLKDDAIHCRYCNACTLAWHNKEVVQPANIPHFNQVCPRKMNDGHESD
jgi:hypothetical protein